MAERSSGQPLVGRFGKQALIYATGMVLSKLLSFLLLPLYTNVLSPADYGVVQLIDMTFEIVSIVAGSRLAVGVFHFYHKATTADEKASVIATCSVMLTFSYAVVAAIAIAARAPLSVLLFQSRGNDDAIRWAALSFACQGLMVVPMAFLRVRGHATTFVVITTVKFVLQALLNYALLVHVGLGLKSVFISNFAASLTVSAVIVWMTHREVGWRFSPPVARDLVRFGLPLVATQVATFFSTYGDRYFIQAYGTPPDVGLYALAYQFGFLLVGVGYAPFSMVWDPARFELAKRPDTDEVFSRAFVYLNVVLISTAVVIALLTPDVLRLMSAPAYWSAATIVPVVLVAYVVQCWSGVQDIGIMLRERTSLNTLANWIAAAVALVGYWTLIPGLRGMGAAIATLLAFVVRHVFVYVASQRLWRVRYQWGPVVTLAVLALVTFLISYSVHIADLWLSLALRFALCAGYVAAVVASGVLSRSDFDLIRAGVSRLRQSLRLNRGVA